MDGLKQTTTNHQPAIAGIGSRKGEPQHAYPTTELQETFTG